MKRVLATMLCLATASVSMAGEWVFFVATGEVGNKIQAIAYDRESISELDDGLNVWFAWVNSNPSLNYDLLLELKKIDCSQKKLKLLQSAIYLRGQLVKSFNKERSWEYAIPGTVGEKSVVASCNRHVTSETITTTSFTELVKKGKKLIKEARREDSL